MKQLLLVFIGGGFGSILRFLVSKNLNQIGHFPTGTFLVNILGSLLIGIILGMGMKQELLSKETTLILATGFCGGFTTFSAFTYESVMFLKSGAYASLGIYLFTSIFLGIAAVLGGLYLSRLF
jgi:fluoride exporter